ncbi:hypothetical protein MPH_04061 [Macrophomina phaseolina MS6]|uniref:Uncharacterized protein n=1 Tax=Macrophomina phaseolina (strain MS6) TaxID=1126212 RepID=K2SPK4_MACPH|nr:hypothetical protein MPH_04061 [Macrophomina phaseolina MS6]
MVKEDLSNNGGREEQKALLRRRWLGEGVRKRRQMMKWWNGPSSTIPYRPLMQSLLNNLMNYFGYAHSHCGHVSGLVRYNSRSYCNAQISPLGGYCLAWPFSST